MEDIIDVPPEGFTEYKEFIGRCLEIPAQMLNVVEQQLKALDEDADWIAFHQRVKAEVTEKFFGTFCQVDVTGVPMKFVQLLMRIYRGDDWFVESREATTEETVDDEVKTTRRMVLIFRDPVSIEQQRR